MKQLAVLVAVLMAGASGAMAQTTMPASAPANAATTQPRLATTQPKAPARTPLPQPKAARPTEAVAADSCASLDCHAAVKGFKVVHGPVNVNACDSCHTLADAKTHRYTLAREGGQLCTFCHNLDLKSAPVVHKPVMDGQCLECHNPHGGETARFIRSANMTQLCSNCHQNPAADKSHVHGPVAAGACDSCHRAHTAERKNLLVAEGRELCLSCHTDMKNQLAQVKFTHKALEQECTSCHDPHASNFAMQVKQAPFDLCTNCHVKQKDLAASAKDKHSAVSEGQACLNCHTPHGGNLASLVRAEPAKMCMKCHDKKIQTKDNRTVPAMPEINNPKLDKHGPIRDGTCSGCHNPHGSENDKLLIKSFPQAFYQGFALEKYALCFSCHDKQLVLNEQAKGLTGFRNGQQNLHFVHVNKQDKGRSCRACHSTHASANERHVRDSVPYGQWQMPINFKKTETGGGCAPGCHKPFSYDREKPADNSVPAPATLPTTAPPARVEAVPIAGGG